MPLTFVTGDPLLTRAPVLAFAYNAAGRAETGVLETVLHNRYPTAFAAFRKAARQGKTKTGEWWMCRETQPALLFMIVRETPTGMTRLRFVEAVALRLARDHGREGIASLAMIAPGSPAEWLTLKPVLEHWLKELPIVVYEGYQPGVAAE